MTWKDEEVLQLLTLRADSAVMAHMKGTAKDSVMYDRMVKKLAESGIVKDRVNIGVKRFREIDREVLEENI